MRFLLHIYVCALASGSLMVAAAEPVEEITVTGDLNQLNLQMAIDTAESDFYAVFNELVEAEFQVSCKQEYVLGSRIKKRVCQTGYQKDLLTRAAMWQSSGGQYNGDAPMAAKNAELSAKARELIETNTALRQAASRLSDLVEQYQDRYTSPD